MPPRLSPKAYKSFGSSLRRLPGWRNDRGTQFGARRSRPPDSSSAASTPLRTLPYWVLSSRTDVGAAAIAMEFDLSPFRATEFCETLLSVRLVVRQMIQR